jgi:hypothetical protein
MIPHYMQEALLKHYKDTNDEEHYQQQLSAMYSGQQKKITEEASQVHEYDRIWIEPEDTIYTIKEGPVTNSVLLIFSDPAQFDSRMNDLRQEESAGKKKRQFFELPSKKGVIITRK